MKGRMGVLTTLLLLLTLPGYLAVAQDSLKVGFVYVGPVGDYGWSYAHDQGRQYLEKTLPDVKTTYVEAVPEGADAERVLTQLARTGHKVIFATSYGYMDAALKVAERFPDVIFLHCSGHKRRQNLGTYFGRMYQASYLTGLVAGKMTRRNLIGYVAPIPIPEVIRIANAFARGAREVNPDVKVHVVWTHAWYDPATESEAANSLLDIGADVIATQSDSPTPVQTAEKRGAYGVGYNSDAGKFAPQKHLVSAVWNWGPYYVETIKNVRAGTWKSADDWWPIDTGIAGLSSFGPAVPEDVKTLVERRKQDLVAHKFDVFWGPIKDQHGQLRIADGEKPSDTVLLQMDWLIEGMLGRVPR
ncbi:MAG TPA: BMP family ABC transporter substrate-binding protein [Alphaproteobacteria bacterium]|nr:BMP family ABC transporter substrate-binding protein [Alphaproteobacteria bacterium]